MPECLRQTATVYLLASWQAGKLASWKLELLEQVLLSYALVASMFILADSLFVVIGQET